MTSVMRSRRAWALLIIAIVIVSIILLAVFAEPAGAGPSANRVTVVRLEGVIQDAGGGGFLGDIGLTPARVRTLLQRAEATRPRAVVLRINSPGGSAAASQEMLGEIRLFKERTGLPVVASLGDVAASGGYYIAVGADEIVANPASLTGSIGVVWEMLDLTGLYEKIGIEEHSIASGRHKEAFSLGKMTPESLALVQEMSDEMHSQFIAAVAEGRGMDVADVVLLATGQPYIGTQARERGLVDELGGLDRAVQIAGERAGVADPVMTELREGFWDVFSGGPGFRSLLSLLEARVMGPELAALRGALEGRSVPRY